MNAKIKYCLLLFFLVPLTSFSQKEYLARLNFYGGISELGVSPSEEVWVATRAGMVYQTKQVGELWKLGPFGSYKENFSSSGEIFERINFFSDDTLMISGYIREDGNTNFVYWSSDHGKTWEKVVFGKNSWIDAAYINSNGKAWMSGGSQLIYYTEDKGKTWKLFDKIEKTDNLRFSTIHFLPDEKTGLFASFWNVLYRTPDNCITWEKLPTPLSQAKYVKHAQSKRPEINKIRAFGEYYLINQEDKVFITSSDTIDWAYLPDALDFEVTEDQKVYIIHKDLSVELFDKSFNSEWKLGTELSEKPRAIAAKNGKLFVLTSEVCYKMSPEELVISEIYTDEITIQEPYEKISFHGVDYGIQGKDIVRFDQKKQQWFRFSTFISPISMVAIYNDHLVISSSDLTKYYCVNVDGKYFEEIRLPKELIQLDKNSIVEFYIEQGSQGCFHSSKNRRTYVKNEDQFELKKESKDGEYLSKTPDKIDQQTINGLVRLIDSSRTTQLSFLDLGISQEDLDQFSEIMDKSIGQLNKDFYSFPETEADSKLFKELLRGIPGLPDETIHKVFLEGYGNWSITTDWCKIGFIFQDGKELIIENSDDIPNYLSTPWRINYNGIQFISNSIEFSRRLDQLTKGQIFNEIIADKNYAIYKIIDYLYQQKLKEE